MLGLAQKLSIGCGWSGQDALSKPAKKYLELDRIIELQLSLSLIWKLISRSEL